MKGLLLHLALFVTGISALSILDDHEYAHFRQASIRREDSPAVGFDLSVDYATSAAYYKNGSILDGIGVDTSKDYKLMLQRLYDSRYKWKCHPGTVPSNWREEMQCRISRARRWLNRVRGRPATPEIGILANLLDSVHKSMSSRLGHHIDYAVISRPDLIHLVTEDIEEAAKLAGFTAQRTRHVAGRVTETSAAYAGSGRGLCKHYEDVEFCEDEEFLLSSHVALRLTLTESALTGSCAWFQSAYFDFSDIDKFYFELGAGNFSQDPSGWAERVQAAVFEVGSYCERFPDTILVLGDHATKPEFVKAVKAALRELLRSVTDPGLHMLTASDVLDNKVERDNTFLAARGAAEFARRASAASSSRHGMDQCGESDRRFQKEGAILPDQPMQYVLGNQDMAA